MTLKQEVLPPRQAACKKQSLQFALARLVWAFTFFGVLKLVAEMCL